MTKPTLLVLAAGMSTRYGGTAKQTDGMGPQGETLLDYSVYDAVRSGFGRVVFVIRRESEFPFREKVVQHLEPHVKVDLAFQELTDLPEGFTTPVERKKPWGTGHAVLAARHLIREPFAVINADDFYGADSFTQLGKFLSQPDLSLQTCRCSSMGFSLHNTLSEHGKVARGICQVENGLLRSVVEMTDIYKTDSGAENRPPEEPITPLTGNEIVSMNMWGFAPELMGGLWEQFGHFLQEKGSSPTAEYYIPLGIDQLIQQGREQVCVLPTQSRWFGVTYQQDKPHVQAQLMQLVDAGVYPRSLW
jgi:dTDP-glucose pyrophosphorylase